ncbi:hypothetical protein C8R46DRAFT_494185 [Mycena filopes]|nr:hypothetical protein C8R46DRAFT_494185 [Mycena filopes]
MDNPLFSDVLSSSRKFLRSHLSRDQSLVKSQWASVPKDRKPLSLSSPPSPFLLSPSLSSSPSSSPSLLRDHDLRRPRGDHRALAPDHAVPATTELTARAALAPGDPLRARARACERESSTGDGDPVAAARGLRYGFGGPLCGRAGAGAVPRGDGAGVRLFDGRGGYWGCDGRPSFMQISNVIVLWLPRSDSRRPGLLYKLPFWETTCSALRSVSTRPRHKKLSFKRDAAWTMLSSTMSPLLTKKATPRPQLHLLELCPSFRPKASPKRYDGSKICR